MEKSFSTLEFSGHFVEQMEGLFDVLKFKKNQTLYTEGSTPLGVFYLQEGEVLISKLASQGREQVIRVVSENGLVCCANLISNTRYSSSCRATMDTTALFLPKVDFLKIISENKEANYQIMAQMAQEVISLENQVVSLAYKQLRGRLADKLLSLDEIRGRATGKNICLSRSDLAGYAGAVTATVNRLLCEFQKEEMISISEKQIRVLDRARLYRISQLYD